MDLNVLNNLLAQIRGCTFATIDCETESSIGIRKVTSGRRVILFTNQKTNGYENMIRRRLIEAGKDPDGFMLHDRTWGERIENSPVIMHKGKAYLQYIILDPGVTRYFMFGKEVNEKDLYLPSNRTNQGLPAEDEVQIRQVNIEHITRIVLMNEQLVSDSSDRAILRIST